MKGDFPQWKAIGGYKGPPSTATALAAYVIDSMHEFNTTRHWPAPLFIHGRNVYQLRGREICIHTKDLDIFKVAGSLERLVSRMHHLAIELNGFHVLTEIVK